MPSPRIVSLVPSATETVYRLGAGEHLVGRSHVCAFPEDAMALPALTRPELESTTSLGIHHEVRDRLAKGLSLYEVDVDRLRELEPTHLLIQDQCAVCAVSPSDLEEALSTWLGDPPEIVRFAPHQLRDVWTDIQSIGDSIGRGREARALREQLAERLSGVVEGLSNVRSRPRVACIEWLDPLMIAGHWIPELVRLAGGDPLLASTGGASTTVDVDTLLRAEPDVVVLQICGFDLGSSSLAWEAQSDLRRRLSSEASKRPRLFVTDGDAFFNRPGPRLVDSAEILAEIFHGSAFREPHHGRHFREIRLDDSASRWQTD